MTRKKSSKSDMDAYEQEIENSLEREGIGALDPEERDRIGNMLSASARARTTKDARINIRISNTDLQRLKRRAAKEGLPYQTMIGSILHKVATGAWDDRK